GRSVLIYDEHGGEQALSAAERLAAADCRVELVTPDRMVANDVTFTIYPDYFRALYATGARFTPDHVLTRIAARDGRLVATLTNDYTDVPVEREVDEVVVEVGTTPVDEL